jgi:hypothetical protein
MPVHYCLFPAVVVVTAGLWESLPIYGDRGKGIAGITEKQAALCEIAAAANPNGQKNGRRWPAVNRNLLLLTLEEAFTTIYQWFVFQFESLE